ncbi:MAG: NTP transferase domain-containing protein [Spirochaetaceae bacterium]|jgi:spore coat polysaccharide biosynthesis protein SpsF|nr:NTP transferase domain-containing protein [Spirochaetaceae bacterium]
METAVILQARLDSRRLAGKALLPLAGKPVVQRVMEALKAVHADEYVLACPEEPPLFIHGIPGRSTSEKEFASLAEACGFRLITGSKDDVLARYCSAIRAIGFDTKPDARIIRATGDNPFVFADAANAINAEAAARNVDYAAYTGLPYGTGVESVAVRALLRSETEAKTAYEREHVCPYIYGHPELFTLYRPAAPAIWHKPELRLTIDTQPDYEKALEYAGRLKRFWDEGMNGGEVIAAVLPTAV